MLQQIQQWLNKFYYYIRILSIDIALGAVSVSLFASHLFNSTTPIVFWFMLPLVVWLIYTFDHITDGLTIKSPFQKPTYSFHFKNQSGLISIAIVLSLVVIILFFTFFDKSLLFIAVVGGGWIWIYFLAHKTFPQKIRNWFPKELFISVGYIIGTFGVPFLTRSRSINRLDILITIGFFLLVLSNVLMYSYFDFEEDRQNEFSGIIQAFGKKSGYAILLIISVTCNILCLYLLFSSLKTIILFIMSLLMSLIIFKPTLFKNKQLYGKIADALFLLPGIIILL